MAIQQLTDGQPDGALVGRSDDKIGFYGLATPIVKATVAATTTTTALTVDIDAIRTALQNLGLIG